MADKFDIPEFLKRVSEPFKRELKAVYMEAEYSKKRKVVGGEFNDLECRFESIWSEVIGCPKEEAPQLYIFNSQKIHAHYNSNENVYGISTKLLEKYNDREVDAVLYHEVGHEACGHRPSLSSKESQLQELQADSVATIYGLGEELETGLDKVNNYFIPSKSFLEKIPLIGGWFAKQETSNEPVIIEDDAHGSHPTPSIRISEINRIQEEYCIDEPNSIPCSEQLVQDKTYPYDMNSILNNHQNQLNSAINEIRDCSLEISNPCEIRLDPVSTQLDSCRVQIAL